MFLGCPQAYQKVTPGAIHLGSTLRVLMQLLGMAFAGQPFIVIFQ
jgi:hypothetical protein